MKTSRVFVSHTSDLAGFPAGRSFVQAVLDAVARAGMAPVDMRYFAAREGQPAEYCQQLVRDCDIYVAVLRQTPCWRAQKPQPPTPFTPKAGISVLCWVNTDNVYDTSGVPRFPPSPLSLPPWHASQPQQHS